MGHVLADAGEVGRAEEMYRRAIADGDRHAGTNLAGVLHARGADLAAFDVLVSAAKGGDDLAYQILGENIDRADTEWAEITAAWSAARSADGPPTTIRAVLSETSRLVIARGCAEMTILALREMLIACAAGATTKVSASVVRLIRLARNGVGAAS